MIIYVSNYKIFRSHGARDTLLPQHQAAVSLAETTRTSCLRPGISTLDEVEAPHLPAIGSKHYLPALRTAVTALFRAFRPLRLYPAQTPSFLSRNQDFP